MLPLFLFLAAAQPPSPPPWHKMVSVPDPRLGMKVLEGCSVEVVAEGPALRDATAFSFQADGSLAVRGADKEAWGLWEWAGSKLRQSGRSSGQIPALVGPRNASGTAVELSLDPLKSLAPGKPLSGALLLGDRFPPIIQGWWLTAHPDRSALVAYRMVREGAGLAMADGIDLLLADRGDMALAQVAEGPDGAIYALDVRLAPGKAGTRAGARILKLTWAGLDDAPALPPHPVDRFAGFSKAKVETLLGALRGEDVPARFVATEALAPRVGEAREALLGLMADAEAPNDGRLAALRLLAPGWKPEWTPVVTDLLEQPGEDLRATAADVLAARARRNDPVCAGVLLKTLGDGDARVRMAVAAALARLEIDGGSDALVNALTLEEIGLPAVRDAFVRGLAAFGAQGMDRLLSAAESGVRRQAERAVAVAAECANNALVESLPRWLENPNLATGQRAALLEAASRAQVPAPAVAAKVLNWLVEHPDEAGPTRAAGVLLLSKTPVIMGEQGKALMVALLKENDPAVSAAMAAAIGRGRLAAFVPEVVTMARAGGANPNVRAEAVSSLLALGRPEAAEAARALLEDVPLSGDSVPAAVPLIWERLFRLDSALAIGAAEKRLPGMTDSGLIRFVLTQGRTGKDAARRLGKAAPLGRLNDADLSALLDDPALSAIRGNLLESWLVRREKPAGAVGPAWSLAEKGWHVFREGKVGCVRCHAEGPGAALKGLGASEVLRGRPRGEAITAMLHPSARFDSAHGAIAFGLKNGQELTGVVTGEKNGMVFILGSDGLTRSLSAADIAARKPLGRSLMSDDMLVDLPLAEVEALVALVQQGIPEGLAPKSRREAKVPVEMVADLQAGKLGDPKWMESVATTPTERVGILLEGIIEAPEEGAARLVLEGGQVERIWVDGAIQPETNPTLRKGSSRVVLWVVPTGTGAFRWRLAKP